MAVALEMALLGLGQSIPHFHPLQEAGLGLTTQLARLLLALFLFRTRTPTLGTLLERLLSRVIRVNRVIRVIIEMFCRYSFTL